MVELRAKENKIPTAKWIQLRFFENPFSNSVLKILKFKSHRFKNNPIKINIAEIPKAARSIKYKELGESMSLNVCKASE